MGRRTTATPSGYVSIGATGFEPATSRPPDRQAQIVSPVVGRPTGAAKRDCTPDCTTNTKTRNDKLQDNRSKRDLAEALALIAKLPLSDNEKAEALRRLLANNGRGRINGILAFKQWHFVRVGSG